MAGVYSLPSDGGGRSANSGGDHLTRDLRHRGNRYLGIPNYFHAPGEGLQPLDLSVGQHIKGHLQVSIVGVIPRSLLAGIGFALGRSQ